MDVGGKTKNILISVLLFSLFALAPKSWGNAPEIEIVKVESKPVIDGILSDEAWLKIGRSFKGVLTGWKNQYGTALIKNQRIVYLGYDDDALYIGMVCYVDDTDLLRYGNYVFNDDCLDVHIVNPQGEYFQIGVSCGGQWDIGRLENIFDFDCASMIGDNFWSTEIAIPWDEIRVKPEPDTAIGFNVAGNDYNDFWVTWGPSYGSFRRPETFSHLILK